MGLDNGIIVKNMNKNDIPKNIEVCMRETSDPEEIEVAYWRKYWGVRAEILGVLHVQKPNDSYTTVDREDLPAILRVLKKYLEPEYFEDNAQTIWTYEEAITHMVDIYISLSWLYDYWELHPEIQVIFYDSY